MRAGRLAIKIHNADSDAISSESLKNEEVYCAAHVGEYGKLCTETRKDLNFEEEEELCFHVGPAQPDHPPSLQLMLYKQDEGETSGRQLLGMGSMSLEDINNHGKCGVKVPLVDDVGKHSGNLTISCRFFPSRSPGKKPPNPHFFSIFTSILTPKIVILTLFFLFLGKSRDALGREVIDRVLVNKGAKIGAQEANARSPQCSPRRAPSREREVTARN